MTGHFCFGQNATKKPTNTDLDPARAPYAGPVKGQAKKDEKTPQTSRTIMRHAGCRQ